MTVFLSWSGERSRKVADALSQWLAKVLQAVDPYLSTDIAKGGRWLPDISRALETAKVGIVCLTPENLNEPWILFEAGALSKTKDAYVCTLLLDLKATDVPEPLGQFQHTLATKDEIKKLVETINSAVGKSGKKELPDSLLNDIFETNWPSLERIIGELRGAAGRTAEARSNSDLLEEALGILRRLDARFAQEWLAGRLLRGMGGRGGTLFEKVVLGDVARGKLVEESSGTAGSPSPAPSPEATPEDGE